MLYEVENLRKESYNSKNEGHETKLLQLWEQLMPNNPLKSRVSKQWTEIGFQGDDPSTDFRGMGMLCLENLLYFSFHHQQTVQQILLHSNHPNHGYQLIVVIVSVLNAFFYFF